MYKIGDHIRIKRNPEIHDSFVGRWLRVLKTNDGSSEGLLNNTEDWFDYILAISSEGRTSDTYYYIKQEWIIAHSTTLIDRLTPLERVYVERVRCLID